MIVWKVRYKGYSVLWEDWTWAVADWLALREEFKIFPWIYPKVTNRYKYHTVLKDFQGH